MDIQFLKGVGPKKASLLSKLNIKTVDDMIFYYPRDYEDRSEFKEITDCKDGDTVSLQLSVDMKSSLNFVRGNLKIFKVKAYDNNGNICTLTWFNNIYIKNYIKDGAKYNFYGKVKRFGKNLELINPVYDSVNGQKVGSIIPIYSLTKGITNNDFNKFIKEIFKNYSKDIEETLPEYMLKELNLMSKKEAIKNIHFPEGQHKFLRARNRLVFEELFYIQILLRFLNSGKKNEKGISFKKDDRVKDFIDNLSFELTDAQKKVIFEIETDMENPIKMNRLIQGDVGSGKTVVAFISVLKAFYSGYQSAMMAPTEILAKQHFESAVKLMGNILNVGILTSSSTAKEKRDIIEKIQTGRIDFLIGTHALIQENIKFLKLGLVITDEQHRFGVKQRAFLSSKGENPDTLVMTATPIPRTFALILYGDLDISTIDELPPGRIPITTYVINSSVEEKLIAFIKKQISEERQVYIVCPLVEESEKLNLVSANELYERFKNKYFNEDEIDLVHGKMKNKEKEEVFKRFYGGKSKILIATTVIEVGVNVPNANTMAVYNADRFGLAQLHQLRGRVGRGSYKSYCILVNDNFTPKTRERMKIMENTNNGFIIAEKDLELRESGDFFGTRQHGIPNMKIANLYRDMDVLKYVQNYVQKILNEDMELKLEKNKIIKENMDKVYDKLKEGIIMN